MASFKLTVRHGPKVSREKHESLGGAVASMREHIRRVRAEGRLPEVSMIRTYEPGRRVAARLEISTGRVLRSRDAGIDVMGDGTLVPFRGGVGRKPIEAGADGSPESAIEAVEAALRG